MDLKGMGMVRNVVRSRFCKVDTLFTHCFASASHRCRLPRYRISHEFRLMILALLEPEPCPAPIPTPWWPPRLLMYLTEAARRAAAVNEADSRFYLAAVYCL